MTSNRKAAQRDQVQVEIGSEQAQPEMYILPEIFYSGESEGEVTQAAPRQSDVELFPEPVNQRSPQPLVPAVDPDIVRQFGELLVEHRDEVALENLSEASELAAEIEKVVEKMSELSATAGGVFETVAKLLDKEDELRSRADENQHQAQREEGRLPAPPAEKKQESVQRQEQLKQRQRKRVKNRDQGWEL